MRNRFTTITIILLVITQNLFSQDTNLDNKLRQADQYWKNNQLNKAIKSYQRILEKGNVPEEYQSLVYLRLADAQFQAKQHADCKSTLLKARTLAVIPPHHILKIDELSKILNGIRVNEHTPVPECTNIVATFYVDPASDQNKNRITYRTIEQALEAAGQMQKKPDLPHGAIEIIIEGDTYSLEKPVFLNKGNSGTKLNPLIIRSASAGKKVLINCGKTLKYWKKETNTLVLERLPEISKNKILVADFIENQVIGIHNLAFGGFSSKRAAGGNARFKTFSVPELYYEGKPQQMARWPNNHDTIVALNKFKDGRSLKWAEDKDIWLHGYWYYLWADAYEKIKTVSVNDSLIELEPPVNRYGFAKSKWHVVNALSEIDTPGEWYISIVEGKIWYFPNDDFNAANCILSLAGPAFQSENCDYLTIKDLDFRFIRGDGLVFTNCSELTIFNCGIKDASGVGITIDGGSSHLIHSCTIESMGRGGIDINAGNKETLVSSGSIIENCRISDLSRIDRTYTPAILLEGVGIKVRNCLFSDIPSSAIRLEGNDMLIELNEFTKCVVESDDQGAIDVWGNPLYRGNVIRWNYFHDIGIPDLHMAAGIRLDDAICGFGIYENIFLRSSNNQFGGIQIHGGKDNFIEGNIFADCHAAISQTAWGQKGWEAALTDTAKPMYKALKKYNWRSELWQNRYPALKNLFVDSDRNYAIDNQAINAKSIIIRKSNMLETLNNVILSGQDCIEEATDFTKYLLSWHQIPIKTIGQYRFE